MDEAFLPTDMLARIVHWCYQSGDCVTATRLLSTHKNPELVNICALWEQPIVFTVNVIKSKYGFGVNYTDELDITVDWGDGSWEDYNFKQPDKISLIVHKYKNGIYRIRIYARKLQSLDTLNDIVSFPSIGNVIKSCHLMFYDSNINIPLQWDTSKITNMRGMFMQARNFNQRLYFNTKNVTDMSHMFMSTESFNKTVLFDTSACTDMEGMFRQAYKFNQPVLFDTGNVINMASMFCRAETFNQPVLFNTSKVIDMSLMFMSAECFNQPLDFNTSNVINMHGMLCSAYSFNQPLNFDTKKVLNMHSMLYNTKSFKQPIKFDVQYIEYTSYEYLFWWWYDGIIFML